MSDTNLAEGLETIAHIVEANFDQNRKNIALWSDVETVIELLITSPLYLKTKYNLEDDKFPKWDNSTLESFSYGLDIFEILLTKYLSLIQNIDITKNNAETFFNDIVVNHLESLTSRSCGAIDEDVARELLDISNANIVINYNYTNIAERFFKEVHSPEQKDKIIHINGSIQPELNNQNEFETNIVIGYTNFSNDDIPKELYPFEKTCRRIIKNTGYVDINEFIEDNWFDLIIIGHSCGIADSDVIGKLLCHKKLNYAVILCHSKYDLVSIFNNIKKIINSENDRERKNNKINTFLDLTSYTKNFRCVDDNKPANKLFFAVEHPKEITGNHE
ncbi:hypothetical protein [Succinimonas sp.]|uniref:hypothetical protein n=1 Tax=Succinimonas sp. TaxID=1936151 RepID=UPI003869E650